MKLFSTTLLFTAFLAGCGGGGGDSGVPGTASYAVAAANHNLLTVGGQWITTGTGSDGRTYRFTIKSLPLTNGVFALTGTSSARAQQTITFELIGGTSLTTGTTQYFDAATDALIGDLNTDDGTCTRTDSNVALPATAAIGSQGTLYTESLLSSCSAGATVVESDTVTWSLENDNGVIQMCQNSVSPYDSGTSANGTVALCVEINSAGALGSRARMSINVPGLPLSLTTRNY
ncbi:hypothetical protein BH11PSE8_BH11PSE8_35750 [soil metagenome]